ncbi:hypothetical protein [Moraxella sp. FZLJ2107]|nr:hypothetical protein [Moraxella sp. FZLJ2107]
MILFCCYDFYRYDIIIRQYLGSWQWVELGGHLGGLVIDEMQCF